MFITRKYHCLLIIFLSISIGGCENKTNSNVDKQKATTDTTLVVRPSKSELSIDTLQHKKSVYGLDEEGNPVQGRVSIEGKNGIGILKDTNGRIIEVVLDKGEQNKLIATDQEGYTYKLLLR
jgi:hypothetical protein